ncbi:unnamed protein product [Brassica rapa subsp. narinosa]
MGNLMGCGGNRLEVDGEAVVEANSSSVQERIQYHKGVVDGLDVETNAVDEIEKGKATLDKVLLNSRRQAALDSLSMLQRYMIDLENATFTTYTSHLIEGAREVEEARHHLLVGVASSSGRSGRRKKRTLTS